MKCRLAVAAALLLIVGAWWWSLPDRRPTDSIVTYPNKAQTLDCPIATVGGTVFMIADAEKLGELLEPPPAHDALIRLTVDAAVAHAAESRGRGAEAKPAASELLGAYQRTLRRLRKESRDLTSYAQHARTELGSMRRANDSQLGPYYAPPPAESASQ